MSDSIKWLPKGEPLKREEYEDLREFANKRGVQLEGFRKIDVDVVLIKEFIVNAEAVLKLYPELCGKDKKTFTLKAVLLNSVTFAEVRKSALHILNLNRDALRGRAKIKYEYEKLEQEKWFVGGTDYRSIIPHEMGHMYEVINKIEALCIVCEVFGGISKQEALKRLKTDLSIYSGEVEGEITSEMFSAFLTGKKREDFIVKFALRTRMIREE